MPIWAIEPMPHGWLAHAMEGLANGSLYAALALALVMVYRATHHINFAQGEMATFATYLCLTLLRLGVPYWGAFLLTLGFAFAIGFLLQRLLSRAGKGSAGKAGETPLLTSVGVSIGLLLLVNALTGALWGYTPQDFPSPFPDLRPPLAGLATGHELGGIAVTLTVMALIWAFFRFTALGLAMRAAASNPESAGLLGIDTERMLALGWGLAGMVGAVAGMMAAHTVFLDPNLMAGVLLYAFAGALLGGIENPLGAVLGGFAVGLIEVLAGAYLVGTSLRLPLALAIIIGVLMLRPAGVFGRARVRRV